MALELWLRPAPPAPNCETGPTAGVPAAARMAWRGGAGTSCRLGRGGIGREEQGTRTPCRSQRRAGAALRSRGRSTTSWCGTPWPGGVATRSSTATSARPGRARRPRRARRVMRPSADSWTRRDRAVLHGHRHTPERRTDGAGRRAWSRHPEAGRTVASTCLARRSGGPVAGAARQAARRMVPPAVGRAPDPAWPTRLARRPAPAAGDGRILDLVALNEAFAVKSWRCCASGASTPPTSGSTRIGSGISLGRPSARPEGASTWPTLAHELRRREGR